jgi:hypothetical protein
MISLDVASGPRPALRAILSAGHSDQLSQWRYLLFVCMLRNWQAGCLRGMMSREEDL